MSSELMENIGHFIVHLHGACTHQYSGDDLQDLTLNSEYSGQDDQGRWFHAILHPRWCPQCFQQRANTIFRSYARRLDHLANSSTDPESLKMEIAYLKGVRDGRIAALNLSLDILKEALPEEVHELDQMMTDMGVEDVAIENLANLMEKQEIVVDDLEEEFERYLREETTYKEGIEEGKNGQLTMESNAMYSEMENRDGLFDMALT